MTTPGQERDELEDPTSIHGYDSFKTRLTVNSEVIVQRDDEPLLDGDDTELSSDAELVAKKDRARNLITAMSLISVIMVAERIYMEAYSQWLYYRFEEQVLGANFSHLNVSAISHPCLETNSSKHNPFAKELDEAQTLSSNFNSYISLLSVIPTVLSNLLFGAYADYIGRKVFFIAPVVGLVVKNTISWTVCYFQLNVYYLFIAYFVNGFTGSLGTLFMAFYVYTADNTDGKSSRSMAMVVVSSVSRGISSLSSMAVGYAIPHIGYMWPMAAATLMVFLGLLGFIFFLRETLPRRENLPCVPILQGVKDVFSFYYKKRPNSEHKRKDFIILTMVFLFYILSFGGHIRTLYLLNEPFCWNSKILGVVDTITGLLSGFLAPVIFRLFKICLPDEIIAVISLLFGAASKAMFGVAQKDWMLYTGFGLDIMGGDVTSIERAIMSRMVPATKRGALFSSIAVLETSVIMIGSTCINSIYARTVSIWKGLTYIILACSIMISCFIMMGYVIMKRNRKSGTADIANVNTVDDVIVSAKHE